MDQVLDLNKTTTSGHTCFFYEDEDERLDLLASYLEQGIAANELCVYVGTYSAEELSLRFIKTNPRIIAAIKKGAIQIFEMNSTYLPGGKFVVSYMLDNVKSFIEDALARGFSGLRTAGEMEWATHHPESTKDVIYYEQIVNDLNEPEPAFIGLCLYPVKDANDEITDGALRTHPTVAYRKQLMKNPLYVS